MEPAISEQLDGTIRLPNGIPFEIPPPNFDHLEVFPFYPASYEPDEPLFTRIEIDVMKQHGLPSVWQRRGPSIDTHLPYVNKSIIASYWEHYYFNHVFVFSDARSCLWFFKKINQTNLSNMRSVVFNLSSGFFLAAPYRTTDDMCEEQRWVQVFEFLRHRHEFKSCIVRFVGMEDIQERRDLTDGDRATITKSRKELVSVLLTLRSVVYVRVENDRCQFLAWTERKSMSDTISSPPGSRPAPMP